MRKRGLILLIFTVLIGSPLAVVSAQIGGADTQNGSVSGVFNALKSPLEGFFNGLGVISSIKRFLGNIWVKSNNIYKKGVNSIMPEIDKKFNEENERLRTEISNVVKNLWQKGKGIFNKNKP